MGISTVCQAPQPVPCAQNRYDLEVWRHGQLLEHRLATRSFKVGDNYSLVDRAP